MLSGKTEPSSIFQIDRLGDFMGLTRDKKDELVNLASKARSKDGKMELPPYVTKHLAENCAAILAIAKAAEADLLIKYFNGIVVEANRKIKERR